jgi:hypothetical protein
MEVVWFFLFESYLLQKTLDQLKLVVNEDKANKIDRNSFEVLFQTLTYPWYGNEKMHTIFAKL